MKETTQYLLVRFQEKLAELTGGVTPCRMLLAVSGGVDSMVMVKLFSLSEKTFGIAHCNFLLRGEDSDLDQQLVKRTAMLVGVPFYSATFDTTDYARENKASIQEAARELRYQWLQEIAFEHQYQLIATAHHLDDSIETLLINLIRGTGIRGLAGIPEKRENIVRPLLFATREEIEEFARAQSIEFRTDHSNQEDKYLRNRIRHHVTPLLKELNPAFHINMAEFFRKIYATKEVLDVEVNRRQVECVFPEREGVSINIKKLLALPRPDFFLFEFLREYSFSFAVCNDILTGMKGRAGTQFFSKTHVAVKDREKIFVKPISNADPKEEFLIFEETQKLKTRDAVFSFEKIPSGIDLVFPEIEDTAMFDFDRLNFPLILRKGRPGDRITPLGMRGSKKISDLLTDLKVPLQEKKETWLLISGTETAWLAGYRISEKFKVLPETKKVFTAKFSRL